MVLMTPFFFHMRQESDTITALNRRVEQRTIHKKLGLPQSSNAPCEKFKRHHGPSMGEPNRGTLEYGKEVRGDK